MNDRLRMMSRRALLGAGAVVALSPKTALALGSGPQTDEVAGPLVETTASQTYINLATYGPEITVSAGPSGMVLILHSTICSAVRNGVGRQSVSVDGAYPSDEDQALWEAGNDASATTYVTTMARECLFGGFVPDSSHTFTLKYRSSSSPGHLGISRYEGRRITGIPL